MEGLDNGSGRETRYYNAIGRGHDMLLRCKDCQALVPFTMIQKLGCCGTCGNRRFTEITTLSEAEMADIVSGHIEFQDRDAFIKEFSGVEL
jgi:hypothetical protein